MTPIFTATGTVLHPSIPIPTTTITAAITTGTPNLDAPHCGLHGLPVGDYLPARYVEDDAGVPVTLEGYYEACFVHLFLF